MFRIKKCLTVVMICIVASVAGAPLVSLAQITGAPTPDKVNYGATKWQVRLGKDYTNAPTPPTVSGGKVYTQRI